VNIGALTRKIATKENLKQAEQTFESSVTLVKNDGDVLPLRDPSSRIALFSLSSDPGDYYAGRAFAEAVRIRHRRIQIFFADGDTGQESLDEAAEKAASSDVIIAALFSSLRAEKGSVGLDDKHVQLIHKLSEGGRPVIIISFGSPYMLKNFQEIDSYLCLYRNTPQTQVIAAKAVFGEIDIMGKLPVSIPGICPLGHGITLLKKNWN
jgi:beta-N-acetylhexosaminidase